MRELYLVYRRVEDYTPDAYTSDGWDLIGVVKDEGLIEQVKELGRGGFLQETEVEYLVKEIYADL